jgi:DNA (cytosine-5)-methyltransferase 1
MFSFHEFFAGGGMARAGLGKNWRCVFANDFDPMKASAYAANWGRQDLICADIAKLRPNHLKEPTDLAWASFPCQDLSLAGDYQGLGKSSSKVQTRSGTFWPFWSLMKKMMRRGFGHRLIVLENVYGALTSNSGRDFAAIASALAGQGYRVGAMVVDARLFVPQSRPRVFFVAARGDLDIPGELVADGPIPSWHPQALRSAHAALPLALQRAWLWWNLPTPRPRKKNFVDLIEDEPTGVAWHTPGETDRLLSMMTARNFDKVREAQTAKVRCVGGVYKRTRPGPNGERIQRAEVRFDDIAGCLRTPAGGSSRQTILIIEGRSIRSRLLSPREAARLMGLPDTYKLPPRYNDAYHVAGDGVVVPVVRHIAATILEPVLACNANEKPLRVAAE